ncbi:hypothetical protein ACFQ4M_05100 [Thauera mechernichensis]|uniref:N-acetyltransferase domain-containing protein n=1 Tax=Thauera mechernichensis TaxID=82788 RepID=A0ABW3WAA8_9RHOO|nr:hypothetical protein [Thauera mechernichensis]MDG3065939.1 hypothetical protein [Thauera mechernichensis]
MAVSSARAPHSDGAQPGNAGFVNALPPPLDAANGLAFEQNGFQIRIANGCDDLKRQSSRLVERMYSARGLFPYGMHAELDRRDITVVALREGHAVATLTLRMDLGSGLLADTLYSNEIDAVRKTGGKVCEITRLAIDPDLGSHDALAGLLQALYVLAKLTQRMSDVFIEVHPRHARFYQRIFGYRVAGPERVCPRVGAAAVLLHLSHRQFERALARHDDEAGRPPPRATRLLPSETTLQDLLAGLKRS